MSGSERAGFAHYEFGRVACAVAVEHAATPRGPGRLDLPMQQINDRLPVTLRGRWRLDRRTGTALAAAVAVAAVVLGGWTLFRAQSKQVAQPQLLAAGHSLHRQTSDSAPRDAEAQPAGLEGAPPAAAAPMYPMPPAASAIGIV